ncbi:carbohydrate kinase family protein [Bifidobacterium apousia]|uniref:carbohydrate kinase family protein n=1 Tax=Bifidobacterium apousia TaxID=2750996 RepID=UPI0018DCB2BC|nr:carbohydrate kinase family protein [Bifidobacterium apousia]MBI0062057.1 carbohydrate kinase family protein [Bifidobacterium apousia]
MPEVAVVGDANVDIIVPYPRFLNPERTKVEYPTPEVVGGGTCANTAVALSRLGRDVLFAGTVGDDSYGRFTKKDLIEARVDVDGLVVDRKVNTVGVFAFIDETGERYLWGWPRDHQSFKELDWDRLPMKKLAEVSWIHSSGMCLTYAGSSRDSIIRLFAWARERGIRTSLDLNLRVDNGELDSDFAGALNEILPQVDYLLGSGPEEFAYLGQDNWRENARNLASNGHVVVARDGSRGSVGFAQGNAEINVPAFKVEVADTVGAGDTYNAGFISAILSGEELTGALRQGNAVSGYEVSHKGARHCPDIQQLDDFFNNHELLKEE